MHQKFQPYSDPSNLKAIRLISQEIILLVEPDEESGADELIDGLVEDYEEGVITTAH